jgi:hypothetical protein
VWVEGAGSGGGREQVGWVEGAGCGGGEGVGSRWGGWKMQGVEVVRVQGVEGARAGERRGV